MGYCQVFTYLYENYTSTSSVTIVQGSQHYQASGVKGIDVEDIYIEEKEKEEDEQFLLKEYSWNNLYSTFCIAHVTKCFAHNLNNYAPFNKHFSSFLFSRSSYLVFC